MQQSVDWGLRPKVLIADDDPFVLKAVAERCELIGFDVETAISGVQALIRASESRPDLIVIDVHMPEVDGISVLSLLVDIAKKSRHVIVMTGHPGQEVIEYCSWFDATCIKKGIDFWREFERKLLELYPDLAVGIRRSACFPAPAKVHERPRVLLVDDDISVRKFYSHKLSQVGADLLHAGDGIRGFWTAWRQQPSVIVADYWMRRGDAEYLLTRLRGTARTSGIPVVVHSGRQLSDATKQRLQGEIMGYPGAARVLEKSSDVDELFEVLQRLCGFARDLDGVPLYQ